MAATFVGGALILCLAAFINGGPILFPDTLTYLLDGQNLVRLTWPSNERPVFYGLAIWFLHLERTLVPVVFAQGLIVAHLYWRTLRALGVELHQWALLGILACLAITTPLSWYVSHIMPDIFTAILILAMFLLGFCGKDLSRRETIYLFVLATAAICFHLSHLPIALGIASAGCLAWVIRRSWRTSIQPFLLIGPIVLALTAFFSFSLVVYGQVTLTPKSPPFLMVRMIVDGPGRIFLQETCGQKHFVICKYLDRLPDTADGILWGFLAPMRMTPDFQAITAEQGSVVAGTVRMFPAQTAWNMLTGMARQMVTIDSSSEFRDWQTLNDSYAFAAPDQDSLQERGLLGPQELRWVNLLHAVTAGASLGLSAALLAAAYKRKQGGRWALLLAIVLFGLLINAFTTGALSGVYGRYGGRIIWLLPFCAIAGALTIARAPRSDPTMIPAGWRVSQFQDAP